MGQRSSRRGRSRGGKQGGRSRRSNKSTFDPNKAWMPEPPPHRDYPPCPVSGEPIDDIYSAIADPRSGEPTRLDSVIDKLSEQEQLAEGERICYIGEGQFGVVRDIKRNGKNTVEIVRRIPYEDRHARHPWRKELSPGISRDYVPQPPPIDELYSAEEERLFPRFGRGGSGYMPR
ncbi:MAG: hypothetical protein EA404_06675 [Spirochaetaceae bacterium]|nr:MAG: hypothetical protein EA404_06675 [Spirochaetaceae bacterium]